MTGTTEIKEGGQLERVGDEKILRTIRISPSESSYSIDLWINEKSVTYLSTGEAISIRDSLNAAIKESLGL